MYELRWGILTWVDQSLGNLKGISSPGVEIARVKVGLIDRVGGAESLSLGGVPGPVRVGERKLGAASVLVKDGVPDGVEVGGTALGGDFLAVATTVTSGVEGVDEGGRVEGLNDVSGVVDDETEGEGALVILVRELGGDLGEVVGVSSRDSALEESGKVGEGLDNVDGRLNEREVVEGGACLIKVWLVGVMPVGLEGVTLALDVVSEGSALGEWVVVLSHEGGVVCLKSLHLVESGSEDSRVGLLKDGLGLSGNKEMGGAPESFSLGGERGKKCDGGERVHYLCFGLNR